jgi:hydroxyacylglutathione hydrolase
MQTSLAKLKALPSHTKVFCAHEYTMSNIRFALAVEPGNAALKKRAEADGARREKNIPTVPFTIADEVATNPFMRWDSAEVIAAAQIRLSELRPDSGNIASKTSPDVVFGVIREWKNHFK